MYKSKVIYRFVGLVIALCCYYLPVWSQTSTEETVLQYNRQGMPMKAAKKDSLQMRDANADSITIFYRTLDSSTLRLPDSSINDITARFPMLFTHIHLGNYGAADRSLLFSPILKSGFDAGFHQFDVYRFSLNNTKFYQTTRPFSQITYLIGSSAEQMIGVQHTQNRKPNFNIAFDYRFSNMPGYFRTQNASHNNLRLTSHYQSKRKRYESFFVWISNKDAVSENGGLQNIAQTDSLALGNPYTVDTRLGSASAFTRNPFNTTVKTGNTYKETILMYQHHYDFGQQDSLVKDTVTIHLFYPRIRFQHTLQWQTNSYLFQDIDADSALYAKYFNFPISGSTDTVSYQDKWQILSNTLSIISFPDKKNQLQFIKAGAEIQNLKGYFGQTATTTTSNWYNIKLLGEYRNKTRNNIWDVAAYANLYVGGTYAGDYDAYISLKRSLSKRIGYLQLGFQNVNRTPSFVFNKESDFPVSGQSSLKKENTIRLFAVYQNPQQAFTLTGNYYAVNNYAYFDSFFTAKQEATLFNVLHLSAQKMVKLSKYFNWYTEWHLQQATGSAPVNLPTLLAINRIAFEGNFYTNLYLSTGIEARYYTRYSPMGYSPFNGQFFYQTQYSVANRPDINFFFNFRIKTFKGFIRLENLNTLNFKTGAFNKYNYTSQNYPTQSNWMRFGIWWDFIN